MAGCSTDPLPGEKRKRGEEEEDSEDSEDSAVKEVAAWEQAEEDREHYLVLAANLLDIFDGMFVQSQHRDRPPPDGFSPRSYKATINFIRKELAAFKDKLGGKKPCVWSDVAHWIQMVHQDLGDNFFDIPRMLAHVHKKYPP